MTELRQREPRQEDAKHLAFVRTQPCCLPHCRREAEPAHLRMDNLSIGKELTGKGEKPHDKYTVPLCPYHHRIGVDCQHNSNEREWWEMRGINPWQIAASLWIASGGADREAMPRPPQKRRPIKARKQQGQRAKIASSARPIPGRRFNGTPIRSVSKLTSRSTVAHGEYCENAVDESSFESCAPALAESDFAFGRSESKTKNQAPSQGPSQSHPTQLSRHLTCSAVLPGYDSAHRELTDPCGILANPWRGYAP